MHSHSLASLYLAASLSLGISCAFWLGPQPAPVLALLVALLILAGYFKDRSPAASFWGLAGLSYGLLGLWGTARMLPENQRNHYTRLEDPLPRHIRIRIREPLRHTSRTLRYTGMVTATEDRPARGLILLEAAKDSLPGELQPGMEILTPVAPEPIPPAHNPGAFDYRGYLHRKGIKRRVRLPVGSFIVLSETNSGIREWIALKRRWLIGHLEQTGITEPQLGVAKALLLGDRTRIDSGLYQDFRKAGALHLLAVSGLHVGILAAFVFALLSPLRRMRYGRDIRLFSGLLLLWGYAFAAGFSPSTVRAVVLFSLVAYAMDRGRARETLHLLALAWMGMLTLIDPYWLFQVGFQLSFAAVAAIVTFYPALYKIWPWDGYPWKLPGKWMAVSLAAQAGTLPLTLFYFHEFPGLFLLSNLILLPAIGMLLGLGFTCLLLQLLSVLPSELVWLYNASLELMNRFITWAGGQEGFHFGAVRWDLVQLTLGLSALLCLGFYLKTSRRLLLPLAAAILLGLPLWNLAGSIKGAQVRQVVIPHKVAQSAVWIRRGRTLQVLCQDATAQHPLIRDALTVWPAEVKGVQKLKNHYQVGTSRLRVLDSTGLYSPEEPPPDYLLLSGSPRVHLGRLLDTMQPKQVIADGSNYYSLLARWGQTCRKRGVPFHATSREGAFIGHWSE